MKYTQAANHFDGRGGQKVIFLIMHGTAGGESAEAVATYFANPATPASAHFVIGQDGEVVQCVDLADAAWGEGVVSDGHDALWDKYINAGINLNFLCVEIEHVKSSTDNSDQITPAQKAASFQLAEQLCTTFGIRRAWANADGGITGHYSMDPVNRSRCPGPYPFEELFAYLNGADDMLQPTDPFVQAYFDTSNPNVWLCTKTKQTVAFAILNYFRQIGGAVRLPVTGEQYNIADVVWQKFEAGILVYDPKHKLDGFNAFGDTYLVKLDSDLAKNVLMKPYVDAANASAAQISALQSQLKQSQVDPALINQAIASAQSLENSLKLLVK